MEIDRTERVGLDMNPISDYNTVLKRLQAKENAMESRQGVFMIIFCLITKVLE